VAGQTPSQMDETNSDAEKSPFAQDAAGNDDSGTVICTDVKNSADSIDQTSPEIHEPKVPSIYCFS